MSHKFDLVGVGLNATDTLLIVSHFPAYAGKVPFDVEILSPGGQVASALADLATRLEVAIPFGILTCENVEQAQARSGRERNVGAEAMDAALEIVALRHALGPDVMRSPRRASVARSRSTRAKRSGSPGRR